MRAPAGPNVLVSTRNILAPLQHKLLEDIHANITSGTAVFFHDIKEIARVNEQDDGMMSRRHDDKEPPDWVFE